MMMMMMMLLLINIFRMGDDDDDDDDVASILDGSFNTRLGNLDQVTSLGTQRCPGYSRCLPALGRKLRFYLFSGKKKPIMDSLEIVAVFHLKIDKIFATDLCLNYPILTKRAIFGVHLV